MYSSSLELVPAGPFHGTMVVTMRPIALPGLMTH
jgi:uncharacterized protein YcsI (UPF0317 family)